METRTASGLSGAALKWIAVISMFIDHAAAVLIEGSWSAGSAALSYNVYLALRALGRLAFPIYCFLLAEGFRHTRDVRKYLLRLLLFGLTSELPFDLAFNRSLWDLSYQNVYFTLVLGLASVWAYSRVRQRVSSNSIPALLAAAPFVALAELGRTDYGAWGAGLVLVLYLLRDREGWRNAASALILFGASELEVVGYVDFALFHFYNGRRGRQPKYFFYVFYPAHLLLLVGLRYLLFRL